MRLNALDSRECTEQREYDRLLAALRDELGDDDLRRLMADGAMWSEDRAFEEAMRI